MIGSICGDVIGSVFEVENVKTKEFDLFDFDSCFTDDSVLTVATMDALIHGKPFELAYKEWFRKYPMAGYGETFIEWGFSDSLEPYNSWGNGSAMRVSPIALWYNDMDAVRLTARISAGVTHNHPEGIRGAEALAAAIFLARKDRPKAEIKDYIERHFNYDLSQSLDDIRKTYRFDVSCQGSVPQAIIAFLESDSYEDCIRNAISIGGDSDTIACMAGGIAEAFYKQISINIVGKVLDRLPSEMVNMIVGFYITTKNVLPCYDEETNKIV